MSDTDNSAESSSPLASASTFRSGSESFRGSDAPISSSSSKSVNPDFTPTSYGSSASPVSATGSGIHYESSSEISASVLSIGSKKSSTRKRSKRKHKEVSEVEIPSSSASSYGSTILSPFSSPSDKRREPAQEILRILALYAFPALLALITGLLSRLTVYILTPLYNSTLLRLNIRPLYTLLACLPVITSVALTTLPKSHVSNIISPRVCLTVIAISADIVLVTGRNVGSLAGKYLGPQWGAFAARWILNCMGIWGGNMFALLCLDHAIPLRRERERIDGLINALISVAISVIFVAHVHYADALWDRIILGPGEFIARHPEKTTLCLCLILTALSLFIRSPSGSSSFAQMTHSSVYRLLKLSSAQQASLSQITRFLPRSASPILYLFRIPLLILALRQQVFLRPSPPYTLADGSLRVLHSGQSLSGRIVVADNLLRGYRYLRCDGSLLGGRWVRPKENETGVDFGDSIFAAFVLQEVGILACRSDVTDSLARTLSLTSEVEIPESDDGEDNLQPRALVIGLGVGISAAALSRRGHAVDVVEIDPMVYRTAVDYFDFRLSSSSDIDTISIMPAQDYISRMTEYQLQAQNNRTQAMQKWNYVIHDCFSAGQLPYEVYTKEFWKDLAALVENDGIIAINIAGVMGSIATRRIVVTLLSVFEQCRAFGELGNEQESTGLMNMVVMCTMAQSPLLSFKPPQRSHVGRSPARIHTYTTFHTREIRLDDVILQTDMEDENMVITQNGSMAGLEQVSTALETWKAMQTILTREMWLAW